MEASIGQEVQISPQVAELETKYDQVLNQLEATKDKSGIIMLGVGPRRIGLLPMPARLEGDKVYAVISRRGVLGIKSLNPQKEDPYDRLARSVESLKEHGSPYATDIKTGYMDVDRSTTVGRDGVWLPTTNGLSFVARKIPGVEPMEYASQEMELVEIEDETWKEALEKSKVSNKASMSNEQIARGMKTADLILQDLQ